MECQCPKDRLCPAVMGKAVIYSRLGVFRGYTHLTDQPSPAQPDSSSYLHIRTQTLSLPVLKIGFIFKHFWTFLKMNIIFIPFSCLCTTEHALTDSRLQCMCVKCSRHQLQAANMRLSSRLVCGFPTIKGRTDGNPLEERKLPFLFVVLLSNV